jgi:hypothetical protein
MKLLGKEFSPDALVHALEARLRARGLSEAEQPIHLEGPEPRVDPAAFYLGGLEANADPTEPLPLHTHRAGLGRAVLFAKWSFRKAARIAIVDTLARQRVFNGYVRDAFLEIFTELEALRRQVAELEAAKQAPAKKPARRSKR